MVTSGLLAEAARKPRNFLFRFCFPGGAFVRMPHVCGTEDWHGENPKQTTSNIGRKPTPYLISISSRKETEPLPVIIFFIFLYSPFLTDCAT